MGSDTNILAVPEPRSDSPVGRTHPWVTWLTGIVFVAGVVGLGVLLVWLFFFVLSPETAATLFIGSLTVFGSVGVALWTTNKRRISEIERYHRIQKSKAYDEVFDFIFKIFMVDKMGIKKTK